MTLMLPQESTLFIEGHGPETPQDIFQGHGIAEGAVPGPETDAGRIVEGVLKSHQQQDRRKC